MANFAMEKLAHFKNPLLEFSQEEQLYRDSIAEFCSREISPNWERYDEESSQKPKVQLEILKKLGEQGVFAMMCKEENGGQGASETLAAIAVEEIAYADPSVALAVYTLLNIGWPFVLEKHGDADLVQRLIPRVSKGEAFFGIASTEAQGGSDIANLRTRAIKDADYYRINGEKSFISGVNEVFSLPWEEAGFYWQGLGARGILVSVPLQLYQGKKVGRRMDTHILYFRDWGGTDSALA